LAPPRRIVDVGHGGGSFAWRVAVPIVGEGFLPDTISTDLHVGSMNNGMKDLLNVLSKFLALGLSLDEVIERSTWNSARAIKQEHSVTCPRALVATDIAVLRVEKGERFGYLDVYSGRLKARAACLRDDAARKKSFTISMASDARTGQSCPRIIATRGFTLGWNAPPQAGFPPP
jgi:dihydroorotase